MKSLNIKLCNHLKITSSRSKNSNEASIHIPDVHTNAHLPRTTLYQFINYISILAKDENVLQYTAFLCLSFINSSDLGAKSLAENGFNVGRDLGNLPIKYLTDKYPYNYDNRKLEQKPDHENTLCRSHDQEEDLLDEEEDLIDKEQDSALVSYASEEDETNPENVELEQQTIIRHSTQTYRNKRSYSDNISRVFISDKNREERASTEVVSQLSPLKNSCANYNYKSINFKKRCSSGDASGGNDSGWHSNNSGHSLLSQQPHGQMGCQPAYRVNEENYTSIIAQNYEEMKRKNFVCLPNFVLDLFTPKYMKSECILDSHLRRKNQHTQLQKSYSISFISTRNLKNNVRCEVFKIF